MRVLSFVSILFIIFSACNIQSSSAHGRKRNNNNNNRKENNNRRNDYYEKYDGIVVFQSGEELHTGCDCSDDWLYLTGSKKNPGVYVKQKSNGNFVIRYGVPENSFILFSSEIHHSKKGGKSTKYFTRLQHDGQLITRKGSDKSGKTVWKSRTHDVKNKEYFLGITDDFEYVQIWKGTPKEPRRLIWEVETKNSWYIKNNNNNNKKKMMRGGGGGNNKKKNTPRPTPKYDYYFSYEYITPRPTPRPTPKKMYATPRPTPKKMSSTPRPTPMPNKWVFYTDSPTGKYVPRPSPRPYPRPSPRPKPRPTPVFITDSPTYQYKPPRPNPTPQPKPVECVDCGPVYVPTGPTEFITDSPTGKNAPPPTKKPTTGGSGDHEFITSSPTKSSAILPAPTKYQFITVNPTSQPGSTNKPRPVPMPSRSNPTKKPTSQYIFITEKPSMKPGGFMMGGGMAPTKKPAAPTGGIVFITDAPTGDHGNDHKEPAYDVGTDTSALRSLMCGEFGGPSSSTCTAFNDGDSYQVLALRWLATNPNLSTYTSSKKIQRFTLACFYFATYGIVNDYTGNDADPWDTSTNWLSDNDECNRNNGWYGILCDTDGAVTQINLPNNKLTGAIPNEITSLHETLTVINVNENTLNNRGEDGHRFLQQLTMLNEFTYYDNFFSFLGIPSDISGLTNLEKLDAGFNMYFGTINGNYFEELSNLQYLDLSGGHFDGGIPSSIASLPSLKQLYIYDAGLQGDLSFIDHLSTQIEEIWIDKNEYLTGSIPASIGEKTKLTSFSASECGLTGSLPSELGLLTNMVQHWYIDNNLVGNIPSEIGNLSNMEIFKVHGNDIIGTMPEEICNITTITRLSADCREPRPNVECTCCTECH